jgi:hypothetical protein
MLRIESFGQQNSLYAVIIDYTDLYRRIQTDSIYTAQMLLNDT